MKMTTQLNWIKFINWWFFSSLLEFFPSNKRGDDNFKLTFDEKGLGEVVKLHKAQASQEAKRDLQQQLEDLFAEGHPIKELVSEIKECSTRMEVPESDVISIVSYFNNS